MSFHNICHIKYGDTHHSFFFFESFYMEVYINEELLPKVQEFFRP